MDHPTKQIPHVIHLLTEGSPSEQQAALETYFVPTASFQHPLCTVPSFAPFRIPVVNLEITSRWVIWMIYRWYKILSPKILLTVRSHDYDQKTQTLFVEITQIFHLFFLPWKSPLNLTTKLHLVQSPDTGRYYIDSQEDLYQSNELLKIFVPWQVSDLLVWLFQITATALCILGALSLAPVTWLRQSAVEKRA